MGFEVDPDEVRMLGDVISKQAEHTGTAITYQETNAAIPTSSGGIISPAEEASAKLFEIAREAIERSKAFFEQSGAALWGNADYYLENERKIEADLDATYKGGEAITPLYPGPGSDTSPPKEVTDPTAALVALADSPELQPSTMIEIGNWLDKLTAIEWIRKLVKECSGKDPFQEVVDQWAGDVGAFVKASQAYSAIANFYQEAATNVGEHKKIPLFWKGNAANLAWAYFGSSQYILYNEDVHTVTVVEEGHCTPGPDVVQVAVISYYTAFNLLSQDYLLLASGVADAAFVINNILNGILELGVWALITAAVTTATSWSGVGAAIGWVATAFWIGEIGAKVTQYTSTIGDVLTLLGTFEALDTLTTSSDTPAALLQSLALPSPGQQWLS